MGSPFLTHAGLLERSTHLIHQKVVNDPQVQAYQFWGAISINDAYGNPTNSGVGGAGAAPLFQVPKNGSFHSSRIRDRGIRMMGSLKGGTHVMYDPDDITTVGAAALVSPEDRLLFVRVQENRMGVGLLDLNGDPTDPVLGPISVVPPAAASSAPNFAFTVQSIAPSSTGCVAGNPPVYSEDLTSAAPRPLHLVFPRSLTQVTIRNLDGANDLLVSFGPGQGMMTIPAGVEESTYSGGGQDIILSCPDVGGCPFRIHGVLC